MRLAALCLCTLALCTASLAAPAPFPRKSRAIDPWASGWDAPVDPRGGCVFQRKDYRLILLREKKADRPGNADYMLTAPRFMRDVDGDFDAQVRVDSTDPPRASYGRRAGLLLCSGDNYACVRHGIDENEGTAHHLFDAFVARVSPNYLGDGTNDLADPATRSAWLRLERRGQLLRMFVSSDAKKWNRLILPQGHFRMPRRVKVGVFAEVPDGAPFKAVFDQFKLTTR